MSDQPKREAIAPSLQDLSYAKVNHSWAFGITNATGKILTVASTAALGAGGVGVAQGLGYLPAIMGVSMPVMTGFGLLGGAIAGAVAAHAIGNIDDQIIANHNDNLAREFRAIAANRDASAEDKLVIALQGADYDPYTRHLPVDALGHAVTLPDEKIKRFPPCVQVDVFRTQADLALYSQTQLTTANNPSYAARKKTIRASGKSHEVQAEQFRKLRNDICKDIIEGTLQAAPNQSLDEPDHVPHTAPVKKGRIKRAFKRIGAATLDAATEVVSDPYFTTINWGRLWQSGDRGGASIPSLPTGGEIGGRLGGGGFTTGGGFGGEGFRTGGGFGSDAAGLFKEFTGGTGNRRSSNNNDGAAAALVIVAAAIAIGVTVWLVGRAYTKNFFDMADKPTLNNVELPAITHALPTAEKDIRKMYRL